MIPEGGWRIGGVIMGGVSLSRALLLCGGLRLIGLLVIYGFCDFIGSIDQKKHV